MVNEVIALADARLAEHSKSIKILSTINPSNAKPERLRFMASDDYNPKFDYKPLEFDPDELKRAINRVETDESPIGKLIESKKQDLLTKIQLLEARNSPEFRNLSARLYGSPDELLLEEAQRLVQWEITPEDRILTAEDAKGKLERALSEYGFETWSIILDTNMSARFKVDAADNKLHIKGDNEFSEQEIERFKVHDIGVHVLRAENGALQPYPIFKTGTPGYLTTEEGLATVAEENAGVLNNTVIKTYAGRVIAVDMAFKGATFRETFNKLREYGFDKDDAYTLTQRAFRGGGFIKDHVYLQGAKDVRKFLSDGGNIDILLIGKIGISDVPLVKLVLATGELNQPKYKLS